MTPDAAERRARALLAIAPATEGVALMDGAHVHALAAQVLSLADALRAAEARAVAAEAERDAVVADHAALAAAVEAVRVASAPVAEASERYRAAWDAVDAMPPTAAQSEGIAEALRVSYVAQETLDAALTALLRGAPGGYVPAGVVREYLDAADASRRITGESYDALDDGAIDDWRTRHGAASKAKVAARTALDAALAAAEGR